MHENNPNGETTQTNGASVQGAVQHDAEMPMADNQYAVSAFLTLAHGGPDHQGYAQVGEPGEHDVSMQESHEDISKPREAVQLKSNIFQGLTVTWSGKFSYPREEIRRKIEENGGQCVENVSKKVNYVLTTPDLSQKPVTARLAQAIKYGIPIIDEQYIHDCVQAGQRLDVAKYMLQVQLPQEPTSPSQQQSLDAVAAQAAAAGASMADLGDQHLRQALQHMMHQHGAQPVDGMHDGQQLLNMPSTPPLSATAASTTSPGLDMSDSSKLQIKMFVKGSRQTVFSEQFPEILYTLTWKHKYDIRIVANKKIFKGEQNKLMEAFTMMLVLAKNNEIPIYDEEKEVKRRRKRQKVAKRKQKKPTDTDTITISSLHKAAENEVIIRFGINSTFCSKRFNYSAFRLYINYAPQELPDDYHFTIYSAEFKTFVKKNANITKYLHYPKQLNPTTTIITKETTTRLKTKYAQVTKHDSGSSFGSPASAPRKGQRKRKRNEYGGEEGYDEEDEGQMMDEQQHAAEWGQQGDLMNMIYPLFLQQQQAMGGQAMGIPYAPNLQKNYQIPEKGIAWFGDPIGMNINGDIFYMAFCKDGIPYKINDFVYLAPEESAEGGQQEGVQQQDVSHMHDANAAAAVAAADGSVVDPNVGAHADANAMSVAETHDKEKEANKAQDVQQADVSADAMQHDDGSAAAAQKPDGGEGGEGDDDDFEFDVATSGAPESYWICKIINLVQTKNEGLKLIGQWFYRWCDVQGFGCTLDPSKEKSRKQYLFQKEKEVFVSFDLNYNSLSTVRGKCFVKYTEPDAVKKNRKNLLKPHRYYFSQGFNRLRSEFFELPEQMLKIMKETTNDDEDADPIATIQQQMIAHQHQQLAAAALASQMPQMAQMGMVPAMGMGGMAMGGMQGMPDASVNTADWNAMAMQQAMQQGMAPQDHGMHPDDVHHHQ